MPLSDDQKAMLRLLAQSDVSYGDIAALKGKSVEEVKAEVEAALAELDGSQAEQPPPPPLEPTPPPSPTPEKPASAAATPSPTAKPSPRPSRPPMPAERRRLLTLMGGALALVAVVLGAIALISGGGEDSGSDSSSAGTANELAAVENDARVTRALLEPADGSDSTGVALFGRVGKEEVVLQVAAEGLEPTADGEAYTVWLYRSPKAALRVGPVSLDEGEDLAARFPIPAELLAYVAGGAFDRINVSRTDDAAYKREVEQAEEQKRLPSYRGATGLRGEIVAPLAEAAAKQGR